MTISEIYKEYKIFPMLREHMFRVAAVASIVCDNFDEPLPKEDIITACLLHDMGNIIKVKFDVFPECWQPEGVEYWKRIQEDLGSKYGTDEHLATERIVKEISVKECALDIINHIGFSKSTINELGSLFENKICNYADMRVGPRGIIPMEDRIEEAHKRYQGRGHDIGATENFENFVKSLENIEKQIFAKCRIKPEDITDETVAPVIARLKNFVIK